MNLSDLLNETTVCCPLISNSRNGAIQELLNHAQNLNYISATIKLYTSIEELKFIRKKHKENLIPWSSYRNSYDWDYDI